MEIDKDVSTRISILRFVMIFGIVILHTPMYVPLSQVGSAPFDLVKAFLQHAVFRSTVPVLTFISGYLLFSSSMPAQPLALISKKFKSLVVPFLVFNLPLVAIVFLLQSAGPLPVYYQLVPAKLDVLLEAAFALTVSPLNYPLYFLRDLFVLCALSSVFAPMLRRAPVAGLVLVGLIFLLNLDGWLVLRTDMPVTFYLGALCAVQKVDMRRLDKYAPAFIAVFLVLCGLVVTFKVRNTTGLRLIAPLLIWPAASLLVETRIGRWLAGMSKYSFFIFLTHAPILAVTWFLYSKYGSTLPYPLYWTVTPWFTTALLIGIYGLCHASMPKLFAWACGTRAPRGETVNEFVLLRRTPLKSCIEDKRFARGATPP